MRPSWQAAVAARVVLLAMLALASLSALGVAGAPAAGAHAYIVSATPGDGTRLDTLPREVRIRFSEPVTLAAGPEPATLVDDQGDAAGSGVVRLADGRRTLIIGVRPTLPKGSYRASWSVISADSHPVSGALQFGYGVPATTSALPPQPEPSPLLGLVAGVAKAILYLGLVAAVGLVPAALVLGAERSERVRLWRLARWGAAVAVVASTGQVVVQYAWDASATTQGATPGGLWAFAAGSYAVAVWVRIAALALFVLALPRADATRGSRVRWTVSGVLAVLTLAAVVRNGHGGADPWRFVSTTLHAAAVVAWLGGLLALGFLVLRGRLSAARLRRLPTWSAYATGAVTTLALSGLLQTVLAVRFPGALVSTTYGYLLLAKLSLVGMALLLGLAGHRWVRHQVASTGADGRPPPGQTARLRGRVRLEAALAASVVAVSGLLSSVTPAEADYAPHETIRQDIGPYRVSVEIVPTRQGPQSLRVTAVGASARTLVPKRLELSLEQPGAQRIPVDFPYRLPGVIRPGAATPTTFASGSVNIPAAGQWTGTLTLVAGPVQQYSSTFRYRVH